MEELLNYLIEQRKERADKIDAFDAACKELEAAKDKVEAFGDMSEIVRDVAKLDEFIAQVSTNLGVVDDAAVETGEVASDGAVTDGEEA